MSSNTLVIPVTGSTPLVSYPYKTTAIGTVATGSGITRSAIATDGVTYLATKQNIGLPVLTVSGISSIVRVNPSTTVTTYNLFSTNNVEITSYDSTFLVGQVAYNSSTNIISRFSTMFTSGVSGGSRIACTGVGNVVITRFTMNSNSPPISMLVGAAIVNGSASFAGSLVLTTDSALTNIIMSISLTNISGSGYILYSTSTLLQNTYYGNTYYFGWIPSGGTASNILAVTSLRII